LRGWLLDTNVISELRKPRCHPSVKAWSDAQAPESLHLSTITIAEIRFGIELQADPAFRAELTAWLDQTLRPWFDARILAVDEEVILEWRRMVARGKRVGHTFSQPDLLLAATAVVHELVVVTRNVEDFRLAEIALLDPWRGEHVTTAI
jgi:predicted nucleic acid-binding protein